MQSFLSQGSSLMWCGVLLTGWEGGAEGFEGNGHGWNGGRGGGAPRSGSGFNGMEGMPPGAIMGGPAVGPGQMLVLAPGKLALFPVLATYYFQQLSPHV